MRYKGQLKSHSHLNHIKMLMGVINMPHSKNILRILMQSVGIRILMVSLISMLLKIKLDELTIIKLYAQLYQCPLKDNLLN